jgi:cysteine desulfurase family protein (TIGR01976 family)
MSMFPIEAVREQFPSLSRRENDVPQIYLDNPAGTQIPHRVVEAVADAMTAASSNLGGYFHASKRADAIWEHAHEAMAVLLNGSAREVIVGPSMTTLTFRLSRSIGRTLEPGDEIIVTRMDHEGDVSPWLSLAEDLGLVVRWLPFNRESWRIEPEDLAPLLTERTRLMALNYASNLTGSINDVQQLSEMAKEVGALVFVDAVQFTPHGLVDVQTLGCDFLACSAYKFFGPHLGVVWGRASVLESLHAYKCRCASDAIPERFETGTPQTELLAGLAAAVDYFEWLGGSVGETGSRREKVAAAYNAFNTWESGLALKLIDGIDALPGTTIHGITNSNRIAERVPTVSFTHQRVAPKTMASALAARGICVWSGHNYAYEVVRHLGIDESSGVLRIGLAHYNTEQEVLSTLDALEDALA